MASTLVCLLHWTLLYLAISAAVVLAENRVEVRPSKNGRNSYVRKEGEAFVLTCAFHSDNGDRPDSFKWLNEDGSEIGDDSQASVYVMRFKGEMQLFFKQVQENDAKSYTCEVTVPNDQMMEIITLVVFKPALWAQSAFVQNATEGQSTTIDCNAVGEPLPKIIITDGKNQQFQNTARYSQAGQKLTISPVQESDQGKIVVCIASQVFEDIGYTNVETRTVRINVQYPPDFGVKGNLVDRYAVEEKNASLPCKVTRANPPVKTFLFEKRTKGTDVMIKVDGSFYTQATDLANQISTLHIRQVSDASGDFGVYKCVATNDIGISRLTIQLHIANEPPGVRVAFVDAGTDWITWELSEFGEGNGEPPVSEFRVRFIRTSTLNRAEDKQERNNQWQLNSKVVHLPVNPAREYRVEALHPSTEYQFQFLAVSEAGWGPLFELSATTKREGVSASAHLRPSLLILSLASVPLFARLSLAT